MNHDSFVTPQMRRELSIERSLEDQRAYSRAIEDIASENWRCAWSMAGSYLLTLGGERGSLPDFTLPKELKHKARVIAAAPDLLKYVMDMAQAGEEGAERLIAQLTADV